MLNEQGVARLREQLQWGRCADPSGAALAAGTFGGFRGRGNHNQRGLLEIFLATLVASSPFLYCQPDLVHRYLEQFSHLSSSH